MHTLSRNASLNENLKHYLGLLDVHVFVTSSVIYFKEILSNENFKGKEPLKIVYEKQEGQFLG